MTIDSVIAFKQIYLKTRLKSFLFNVYIYVLLVLLLLGVFP